MPRARIADVARAAGVAPSTVSHALSGRRPVSPAVLARVNAAVEQLDYRASALARGLRTQRTLTVALVIADISNPFYPAVARGVQDAMSAAGYQVVVCSTDGDPTREASFVQDMISRSVDGIIMGLFHTPPEALDNLVDGSVPIVMLGSMAAGNIGDRVMGDDQVKVAEATARLIDTGRSRIAYIGAEHGTGAADARRAGYEDALLGGGLVINADLIVDSDYSRAGGVAGVKQLLARGVDFDAVVCVNDLSAIGAMEALRAVNRSVPDDVAVVGFDDIEAAELVRPSLTTIDNRAYEKGTLCGRLLLQRLTGELTGPFRNIVVPGQLIVRESA